MGQSTVERIRKRCVEEGVESALNRKKQLRRRQKRLDGEGEARLIAMACGEPPEGRASWTLKLLADQLVECEIVGTISTETVPTPEPAGPSGGGVVHARPEAYETKG